MNRELRHHGILGQKWGVRRFQNPDGSLTDAGKKRYGSINTSKEEKKDFKHKSDISVELNGLKKRYNNTSNDHKYHNYIVNKAKRSGKSAAEIEHEERSHKGISLTDDQKKAIAIGAAVAVTAIAAYGVYKYTSINKNNNGEEAVDEIFKKVVGSDSGKTDFITSAFEDISDYHAFGGGDENKKIINDLLTKDTGKWWNGCSSKEKKAIEDYTHTKLGDTASGILWNAKGDDLFKYTDSKTAQSIMNINNALSRSSFPTSMVCSHGTSIENASKFLGCSEEELFAAAKKVSGAPNLVGKTNINHGMISTTTTAGGGYSNLVKYRILLPKGAHAAYIEHISAFGDLRHPPSWNGKKSGGPPFSREFETLIKAGSKFKTKGVSLDSSGVIEVALEYLLDT